MTTVIKVNGLYLESMDFEYSGGRGYAKFTRDEARAMKFTDKVAALLFYQTVSKTVPRRPDGKPNRPLTGYPLTEFTDL